MNKLINLSTKKSWLILSLVFIFLFFPAMTLAGEDEWEYEDVNPEWRSWGEEAGLPTRNLRDTASSIVQWLLGLLAFVAVVMIIIGGFWWMTAGGNDEKVGKAKNMIQAAVIGLVIILLAWAITIFVIEVVENAQTTPTP